jgi:hypothetical protein
VWGSGREVLRREAATETPEDLMEVDLPEEVEPEPAPDELGFNSAAHTVRVRGCLRRVHFAALLYPPAP